MQSPSFYLRITKKSDHLSVFTPELVIKSFPLHKPVIKIQALNNAETGTINRELKPPESDSRTVFVLSAIFIMPEFCN